MGLMYQFPVKEDPTDDRILVEDNRLVLKSYGLPFIFWGYLAAVLIVISFMFLAIRGPVIKVMESGDSINQLLGIAVLCLLLGLPLVLLGFFFYEKNVIKSKDCLILIHKVFWIPVYKTRLELASSDAMEIDHFMDSPNMARIQDKEQMKAFQNRGYHQLFAIGKDQRKVLVDRSSRLGELKKMKDLLASY